MRVYDIAHSRTGDKGNISTMGIQDDAVATCAAYRVTENGQTWYFTTSPGEELLDAAQTLRRYCTSVEHSTDKFISLYSQAQPITPEEYQRMIAKHAHLRSTSSSGKVFRINVEGSEAKHSFHKDGTDCSLYVFEAPIDLLSHITLYPTGWLEHSYVACCGTSVQPVLERLRQNPKLNMVYLCLDNDEAGEDACENMMEVLEEMDVDVERLRPQGKDWNDDLCAKRGGHG